MYVTQASASRSNVAVRQYAPWRRMGEWRYTPAPLILNRGPRWKWPVSFTPRPHHPRRKCAQHLGGAQSLSGQFGERRIDPRFLGSPARDLVTIPTALHRVPGFSKPLELWGKMKQQVNNQSIDQSINQSACMAILRVTFTGVKQSEWDVHLKLWAGVRGYVPPCPLHSFMELVINVLCTIWRLCITGGHRQRAQNASNCADLAGCVVTDGAVTEWPVTVSAVSKYRAAVTNVNVKNNNVRIDQEATERQRAGQGET
jgi:hypothetical protein